MSCCVVLCCTQVCHRLQGLAHLPRLVGLVAEGLHRPGIHAQVRAGPHMTDAGSNCTDCQYQAQQLLAGFSDSTERRMASCFQVRTVWHRTLPGLLRNGVYHCRTNSAPCRSALALPAQQLCALCLAARAFMLPHYLGSRCHSMSTSS